MNLQESIDYLQDYRDKSGMSDYDYQDFGRVIKCLREIQAQEFANKQAYKAYKDNME